MEKSKIKKLHIGCGRVKMKGFINIDKAKEVKPDKVVDIEKGIPFPDNSFEHIYSSHVLEHIRPQYWDFVLKEMARVAKNGCILELHLPFDNIYQRSHANHYRTFNWDSFYCHEEHSGVNYYSDLVLKNLQKRPNIFIRLWYNLFPFLKQDVYFKFKIIKKYKNKGKDL